MSKKSKYPRPWKATGCGSFREIREGVFQMRWRPRGVAGPDRKKTVHWKEHEVLAFIARQAANRERRQAGAAERVGWSEALEWYERKLKIKKRSQQYLKDVVDLLQRFRTEVGMDEIDFSTHRGDFKGKDISILSDQMPLEKIEAIDCQGWLDNLALEAQDNARGDKLGWAKTVNTKRKMIVAFFNALVRSQKLPFNPMANTETFDEVRRARDHVPPAEYGTLYRASEPGVRDLLDWFLLTGARFSEVAEAKVEDVDDSRRLWFVGGRKGRNELLMPLNDRLLEIAAGQKRTKDGLLFHKWVRPVADPHPFAINHRFGEGDPIDLQWWNKVLKRRCVAAGIPVCTAHQLRHSAATWADGHGLDVRTVQKFLGHENVATTESYMHGGSGAAKMVQEALEEIRTENCK